MFLSSSANPRKSCKVAIARVSFDTPKYNARHELVCLLAESKVYATSESKRRRKGKVQQILSIICDVIFGKARGRGLPRSIRVPETAGAIIKEAAKFVIRLLIETSVIASLLFAYLHCHSKVNTNFIATNLCRWIVVSLFLKMGMLHSRITSSSSLPSLDRNDWFLKGSYQAILEDVAVPVEIRQSPANGSCLFNSIAAGLLYYDESIITSDNTQDNCAHPPISTVIEYASDLRAQAVNTLENGIASNSQLIIQSDETISASSLDNQAASQYGITTDKYISNMRLENVWGGGPEIVALANGLKRQIVLLEPVNDETTNVISLKPIARFGPLRTTEKTIYILSTNIKFPKEYKRKKSNHFLAVFPSQPF